MKTGFALGFICLGAILAFAVTGNTSVFNIHTAGWVIMLVGLIGLFLPRRNREWLGRRVVVRRTRGYPSAVGPVEEIPVPPYVARNPGTARLEAGLPDRPTLMTEREPAEPDPIEDAGDQAAAATQPTTVTRPTATPPRAAPQTEVIEDLYENP
jgi:hypothetical protein